MKAEPGRFADSSMVDAPLHDTDVPRDSSPVSYDRKTSDSAEEVGAHRPSATTLPAGKGENRMTNESSIDSPRRDSAPSPRRAARAARERPKANVLLHKQNSRRPAQKTLRYRTIRLLHATDQQLTTLRILTTPQRLTMHSLLPLPKRPRRKPRLPKLPKRSASRQLPVRVPMRWMRRSVPEPKVLRGRAPKPSRPNALLPNEFDRPCEPMLLHCAIGHALLVVRSAPILRSKPHRVP